VGLPGHLVGAQLAPAGADAQLGLADDLDLLDDRHRHAGGELDLVVLLEARQGAALAKAIAELARDGERTGVPRHHHARCGDPVLHAEKVVVIARRQVGNEARREREVAAQERDLRAQAQIPHANGGAVRVVRGEREVAVLGAVDEREGDGDAELEVLEEAEGRERLHLSEVTHHGRAREEDGAVLGARFGPNEGLERVVAGDPEDRVEVPRHARPIDRERAASGGRGEEELQIEVARLRRRTRGPRGRDRERSEDEPHPPEAKPAGKHEAERTGGAPRRDSPRGDDAVSENHADLASTDARRAETEYPPAPCCSWRAPASPSQSAATSRNSRRSRLPIRRSASPARAPSGAGNAKRRRGSCSPPSHPRPSAAPASPTPARRINTSRRSSRSAKSSTRWPWSSVSRRRSRSLAPSPPARRMC